MGVEQRGQKEIEKSLMEQGENKESNIQSTEEEKKNESRK